MKDVGLSLAMSRASRLPPPKIEVESLSVTENGTYTAEEGKAFNPVDVNVQSGTQLNIAYGQTAPEDTSKIWIKADEPESLDIKLVNKSLAESKIENAATTHRLSVKDLPFGFFKGDYYYTTLAIDRGSYSTIYHTYFIKINIQTGKYTEVVDLYNSPYNLNELASTSFCFYDDETNLVTACCGSKASNTYGKKVVFDLNTLEVKETSNIINTYSINDYLRNHVIFGNKLYGIKRNTSGNKILKMDLRDFSYVELTTDQITPGNISLCENNILFFDRATNKICKYSTTDNTISKFNCYEDDLESSLPTDLDLLFSFDGIILYGACGSNSDKSTNKLYKFILSNGIYFAEEMSSTFGSSIYDAGNSVPAISSPFAFLFSNRIIYKLTFGWALYENKAELYIYAGDGETRAYLFNTAESKQEINSCKYFYGDASNKATSAPVYYHNGTDWVEFM